MDVFNLGERAKMAISLGESHFREFKSAIEGRPGQKKARQLDKIAQDIGEVLVSFANADGGELIVGVEDDGEVSGTAHLSERQLNTLLEAPKNKVHKDTPLPSVRVARVSINDSTVVYFSVPKSTVHIHLTSKGHCLQRRDLETVPVAPEHITFERQERASREYDRQFVDGTSAEILELDLVAAVANQLSPGMSPERCLQYLDLAEYLGPGLRLRRAALLLFATEPHKWHPRLQVRIMKVQGTEVLTGDSYNVVSDTVCSGNILQLIEDGWETLRPHLVQTRLGESARFETTIVYPELACREALVNAIAHRDYSDEGKGIEIYVYQDRLEVRSPGALLSTISIEDLLCLKGVHQSRNALISRVLRELGYMRELGEGLRRIFDLMQKNELTQPELVNSASSFSITLHHKTVYSTEENLWLEQFGRYSLTREQKSIVVMGLGGRLIAPQDIWDNLGIVDTEHYRKLVASLQELGILKTAISKTAAYNKAKARGIPVRRLPRLAVGVPTTGSELQPTARKRDGTAGRPSKDEPENASLDSPDVRARLWLGNLREEVADSKLLEFLNQFGRVQELFVPRQLDGKSRGYAFVEYDTVREARFARGRLNGTVFDGRKIAARPAAPRKTKYRKETRSKTGSK